MWVRVNVKKDRENSSQYSFILCRVRFNTVKSDILCQHSGGLDCDNAAWSDFNHVLPL